MKIAVLGTGVVGRAVAGRLDELGHDVTVGTRDPAATLARDPGEATSYAAWQDAHPGVGLASYASAAADVDLVVLATNGDATLAVVELAGDLDGTVVLDITNPLDFSQGFPPSLTVSNTDSLAEQVQRAAPGARVVKSLNTMNNQLMVQPRTLAGGDHSVFVSGDDASAKDVVTALLTELGHTDVIDLGDLSTARGAEMLLPLWVRLMGALGTAHFNIKVVREG